MKINVFDGHLQGAVPIVATALFGPAYIDPLCDVPSYVTQREKVVYY